MLFIDDVETKMRMIST